MLVSLGAVHGAEVFATASQSNHQRLRRPGAHHLLDYHDRRWSDEVRRLARGEGVEAAVHAVRGGVAEAIRGVRDGGQLVTIASDPPDERRGIAVTSLYVRPDGPQLQRLSELLGDGRLQVAVGSMLALSDAGEALARAVKGHGGQAIVLQV